MEIRVKKNNHFFIFAEKASFGINCVIGNEWVFVTLQPKKKKREYVHVQTCFKTNHLGW